MKKKTQVLLLLVLFGVLSCDSDKGLTCFKTAGTIIRENIAISESFNKVTVFQRVQLVLRDAPDVSVTLETGENIRNDIKVFVENGVLNIVNEASCNLVREYGITKVFISHPNIEEVRNSSGLPVLGQNIIEWPNVKLLSDDLVEEDFFHKDGDFNLSFNSQNVSIVCNGLSNFFLSGNIENLDIQLLEGDSRLPLENLNVNHVKVFHRGTNDIIVSPNESISGELRSTGNLILKNRPAVLNVETFFTGRVIISD